MERRTLIMAIKCTVTTDLQAKNTNGYSGMQKHVSHDQNINHSNKDIVFDETQFNIYNESKKVRDEIDAWNKDHFQSFIDEHDKNQREKNHAERQYGTVKNYLAKKKKATAVLTIGSMEVQSTLMKQFCPKSSYHEEKLSDGNKHLVFTLRDKNKKTIPDNIKVAQQFYDCFNRALIHATDNNVGWKTKSGKWVHVGDYLHRGRYATNNDEMGISHIHYELATFGMTRGGKKRAAHATNSLNQALVSLHHAVTGQYVSGRTALKWYRAGMDKFALKCLEKELHRTYQVSTETKILDFERKTKEDKTIQTGLSMKQLKSQHEELAKHKKQVKAADDALTKAKQDKQDLEEVKQQAENAIKNSYETITGQKAVDKNNNPLSPLECAKRIKSVTDQAQKNKQQAEEDQKVAEKAKKDAEAKQRAAENARQQAQQRLNQINKDINDADDQLKQRKQQRTKELQQEIDANNIKYKDNKPVKVTGENVDRLEPQVTNWKSKRSKQLQKQVTDNQVKLKQQKQDLQDTSDLNSQLQAENDHLKDQNKQLNATNNNLTNQQSQLHNNIKQLTTQKNTLLDQIKSLKKQVKQVGLSISSWVKNHWSELKAGFEEYATNKSFATNERLHGGEDHNGDPWAAQHYEHEAKSALFNTFDNVERTERNKAGLTTPTPPTNTKTTTKNLTPGE